MGVCYVFVEVEEGGQISRVGIDPALVIDITNQLFGHPDVEIEVNYSTEAGNPRMLTDMRLKLSHPSSESDSGLLPFVEVPELPKQKRGTRVS